MIRNADLLRNLRFFFVAVAALALQVCAVTSVSAASYSIYGRVYSAARLMPEQTPPTNPLSAYSSSLILKDKDLTDIGLYAVTAKSMVRVSVEDQYGTPYANPFLVKYSGGYNFSFNNAAASLSVKLVVRNALSNEKLMESALTAISPSPNANTRYLLVEGDHDDMGKPHPGTNLFTMVGRIPNDGTSISPLGLANVSAITAAQFGIPQYQNAPFGSTLNITGAFSSQYYPTDYDIAHNKYCYKVLANGVPIKTPLFKMRYTVTNVNGTLMAKAEQVKVGPQQIGSVAECYAITPIAQTQPNQEVFWNLPDQLIRWDTSLINNGQFQITLKLYNTATNATVNLGENAFSTLKLQINNEPVVVGFSNISNGAKDMLDPANACDIVNMAQGLNIIYKAYHPNAAGYLSGYSFAAVPNHGPTIAIASGSYTGTPFSGTPAGGVSVALSNSQISHSCAYIFMLSAVARTTDGYWNFNRGYAERAFYLQKP